MAVRNAVSFEWTFGDGQVSNEVNPTHTYQDGYFTATLIATNGCVSDTFYFDINIFTGVEDITDDPSIQLLPNPSSGKFVLRWDGPIAAVDIKVYSLSGKSVFSIENINNHAAMDLSGLPAGVYVMHIVKEGVRSMKRIVIQYIRHVERRLCYRLS